MSTAAIVGVGAIGGFIAVRLARAGWSVAAVARGATAAALRERGLCLEVGGERLTAAVDVAEHPAALGAQDLVVIAVKAPAMAEVAPAVAPLLGPDPIVLPAMNGVPWWFFDGFGGAHAGLALRSIDPEGAIARAIPTRHVVGCVVHAACSLAAPGHVRHAFGERLIIGEPDRTRSARVLRLAERLDAAGFTA